MVFAQVNGSIPPRQKVHLLSRALSAGQKGCRDVNIRQFFTEVREGACIMSVFTSVEKGVPFRALRAGGPMEGGSAAWPRQR